MSPSAAALAACIVSQLAEVDEGSRQQLLAPRGGPSLWPMQQSLAVASSWRGGVVSEHDLFGPGYECEVSTGRSSLGGGLVLSKLSVKRIQVILLRDIFSVLDARVIFISFQDLMVNLNLNSLNSETIFHIYF